MCLPIPTRPKSSSRKPPVVGTITTSKTKTTTMTPAVAPHSSLARISTPSTPSSPYLPITCHLPSTTTIKIPSHITFTPQHLSKPQQDAHTHAHTPPNAQSHHISLHAQPQPENTYSQRRASSLIRDVESIHKLAARLAAASPPAPIPQPTEAETRNAVEIERIKHEMDIQQRVKEALEREARSAGSGNWRRGEPLDVHYHLYNSLDSRGDMRSGGYGEARDWRRERERDRQRDREIERERERDSERERRRGSSVVNLPVSMVKRILESVEKVEGRVRVDEREREGEMEREARRRRERERISRWSREECGFEDGRGGRGAGESWGRERGW